MDEIMKKLLPSNHVVNAVSRIPDQRVQNLVMKHFSQYEDTAWTVMFKARDWIDWLTGALDRIYAISAQGLVEGNPEEALREIYKLSKEFQEEPREELTMK